MKHLCVVILAIFIFGLSGCGAAQVAPAPEAGAPAASAPVVSESTASVTETAVLFDAVAFTCNEIPIDQVVRAMCGTLPELEAKAISDIKITKQNFYGQEACVNVYGFEPFKYAALPDTPGLVVTARKFASEESARQKYEFEIQWWKFFLEGSYNASVLEQDTYGTYPEFHTLYETTHTFEALKKNVIITIHPGPARCVNPTQDVLGKKIDATKTKALLRRILNSIE